MLGEGKSERGILKKGSQPPDSFTTSLSREGKARGNNFSTALGNIPLIGSKNWNGKKEKKGGRKEYALVGAAGRGGDPLLKSTRAMTRDMER